MNQRRQQSKARHERKRRVKHADIRVGRIYHQKEHNHVHETEPRNLPIVEAEQIAAVVNREPEYILTRNDIDLETGRMVEAEVARGTKGQMEARRHKMYKNGEALVDTGELHVRKAK